MRFRLVSLLALLAVSAYACISLAPVRAQVAKADVKDVVFYGDGVPGVCVEGQSPAWLDVLTGKHYECQGAAFVEIPGSAPAVSSCKRSFDNQTGNGWEIDGEGCDVIEVNPASSGVLRFIRECDATNDGRTIWLLCGRAGHFTLADSLLVSNAEFNVRRSSATGEACPTIPGFTANPRTAVPFVCNLGDDSNDWFEGRNFAAQVSANATAAAAAQADVDNLKDEPFVTTAPSGILTGESVLGPVNTAGVSAEDALVWNGSTFVVKPNHDTQQCSGTEFFAGDAFVLMRSGSVCPLALPLDSPTDGDHLSWNSAWTRFEWDPPTVAVTDYAKSATTSGAATWHRGKRDVDNDAQIDARVDVRSTDTINHALQRPEENIGTASQFAFETFRVPDASRRVIYSDAAGLTDWVGGIGMEIVNASEIRWHPVWYGPLGNSRENELQGPDFTMGSDAALNKRVGQAFMKGGSSGGFWFSESVTSNTAGGIVTGSFQSVRFTPTFGSTFDSDTPPTCGTSYKRAIYYDGSLNEYCVCDGTNWIQLDGGGAGTSTSCG